MTLHILLSFPVTLEDIGVDTVEELREGADEFGCNIFNLGEGQYLFTSNNYLSLMKLQSVHDAYRGVIVEVSTIYG